MNLNHDLNWQEIENFFKLRKLIKRNLCYLKDLVFARALVTLDCISCKRARLSLKQVLSSGSEHFTSCFGLVRNLIRFLLFLCIAQERQQCKFERSTLHRPFSKGISGRLETRSKH